MSYLFVMLMCYPAECKFFTNGDLTTLEKCSKNIETFQKIDSLATVDFIAASCVRVKTKEKTL